MNEDEIKNRLDSIEKRLDLIEGKNRVLQTANLEIKFSFKDKKKKHNLLLEELLKSEYCHSNNGLNFDKIMQIFIENKRPVVPKKVRDLLAKWKKRKKIDAIENEGKLNYFWIENESKKSN